jgi:hypothetical protein
MHIIAILDVRYKCYYIAYCPLGSPAEMAPPDNYVFRPPSFIQNCIGFLFGSRTPVNNEETILQQIAQYVSSLDEMIEKLDNHDQLAREIDSSDVSAWPTKYDAWLGRRRIVVKIDEVSLLCCISSFCLP